VLIDELKLFLLILVI